MKTVVLMFDSLNRRALPGYGGWDWVHAPNFARLARKSVQFNNAWCGSMPCMPARREMHTGRPNFLHCNWGALEPFDDSAVEMLKNKGVLTHLISDHYHYWEENAATYHTKFNSWEFFRGQEGDPWIAQKDEPHIPENINAKGRRQDWVNRPHIEREEDSPTPQTIRAGIDFLETNGSHDDWFLQLECFDPHEPFFTNRAYKDRYHEHYRDYDGPLFDWPGYRKVEGETPEQVEHLRYEYASLLTRCDALLGDVLDTFDRLNLWNDTMLIVNTDHGFMLGEKGHFAKNYQPWWNELAHIPLYIYDPRARVQGETRESFVQTIDLAPTILDAHGLEPTPDMIGVPLTSVIQSDTGGRAWGLFGNFGMHVNVTDGRHVYMRAATTDDGGPMHEFTLLPVAMRQRLAKQGAFPIELVEPFSFTKGMEVLKVPMLPVRSGGKEYGTLLYDLEADYAQEYPITDDPELEQKMIEVLVDQMKACDAPRDQFVRLGLEDQF